MNDESQSRCVCGNPITERMMLFGVCDNCGFMPHTSFNFNWSALNIKKENKHKKWKYEGQVTTA